VNQFPEPSIMHRCLTGETSEEENEELKRWRSSSPENETLWRNFEVRWQALEPPQPEPDFDLAKGWTQLAARLKLEEATAKVEPIPRATPKRRRPTFTLIAAAAALVVSLLIVRVTDSEFPVQTLATGPGERQLFTLPDGSRVHLDADSSLRFVKGFADKQRLVRLEGHGYFEVQKGNQPFTVRSAVAKVQVLGTQFDVWSGNNKSRVMVKEGSVSVVPRKGGRGVILEPGMMGLARAESTRVEVTLVTAKDYLGWLDGKLVWKDSILADVVIDLRRFFGASVVIDDATLENEIIYAEFDAGEDLEKILFDIFDTNRNILKMFKDEKGVYHFAPPDESQQ